MSGLRQLFQGKESENPVDQAIHAINDGNDVYSNIIYLNDLYPTFSENVLSSGIPACVNVLQKFPTNSEILLAIFSLFNTILSNNDNDKNPHSRILIETDSLITSLLKCLLAGTIPCQTSIFRILTVLSKQNRHLLQEKLFESHDQFISVLSLISHTDSTVSTGCLEFISDVVIDNTDFQQMVAFNSIKSIIDLVQTRNHQALSSLHAILLKNSSTQSLFLGSNYITSLIPFLKDDNSIAYQILNNLYSDSSSIQYSAQVLQNGILDECILKNHFDVLYQLINSSSPKNASSNFDKNAIKEFEIIHEQISEYVIKHFDIINCYLDARKQNDFDLQQNLIQILHALNSNSLLQLDLSEMEINEDSELFAIKITLLNHELKAMFLSNYVPALLQTSPSFLSLEFLILLSYQFDAACALIQSIPSEQITLQNNSPYAPLQSILLSILKKSPITITISEIPIDKCDSEWIEYIKSNLSFPNSVPSEEHVKNDQNSINKDQSAEQSVLNKNQEITSNEDQKIAEKDKEIKIPEEQKIAKKDQEITISEEQKISIKDQEIKIPEEQKIARKDQETTISENQKNPKDIISALQELKNRCESMQRDILILKSKHKALFSEQIDVIREKNSDTQRIIEENRTLKFRISQLLCTTGDDGEEKASLTRQIEAQSAQLQKLTQDNIRLSGELMASKDENSRFEEELNKWKAQNLADAKKPFEDLQRLANELKRMKEENTSLSKQLETTRKFELENISLKRENADYMTRNKSLLSENETLKKEREKLLNKKEESDLQTAAEASSKILTLSQDLSQTKAINNQLQQKITRLEEENNKLLNEKEKECEKNSDLNRQLLEKETEIKKLQDSFSGNSSLQSVLEQIQKVANENASLSVELSMLKSRMPSSNQDSSNETKNTESLRKDSLIEQLQNELTEKDEAIDELKDVIDKLDVEYKEIITENENLQNEIKKQRTIIVKSLNEIKKLRATNERKSSDFKKLTEECLAINNEKNQLTEQLKEKQTNENSNKLQVAIKHLHQENLNYKKQHEHDEYEINELKTQLSSSFNNDNEKDIIIKELQSQIQSLSQNRDDSVISLKEEISNLSKKNSDLENELRHAKEENEFANQSSMNASTQNSFENEERMKLKKMIEESEDEKKVLQSKISVLQANHRQNERALQKRLNEKESEFEALKVGSQKAAKEIEKLRRSQKNLQSQLDSYQRKSDDEINENCSSELYKSRVKELEDQVSLLQSEVEFARSSAAEARAQQQDLTETIQALENREISLEETDLVNERLKRATRIIGRLWLDKMSLSTGSNTL